MHTMLNMPYSTTYVDLKSHSHRGSPESLLSKPLNLSHVISAKTAFLMGQLV